MRTRTLDGIYNHLKPFLREGMDILDVGCGPGSLTADVADYIRPGKAYGIDAIAISIREGLELKAQRGIDNLEFLVGNVFDLPFEQSSFDLVYAMGVFDWLPNWTEALSSIRNVLKPKGKVYLNCSDWGLWVDYPKCSYLDKARRAYQNFPEGHDAYYDPWRGRRILEALTEAGFSDVSLAMLPHFTFGEEATSIPRLRFFEPEGPLSNLVGILLEDNRISVEELNKAINESMQWGEASSHLTIWPAIAAAAVVD
jgi:SAM-dependent methyltransferase